MKSSDLAPARRPARRRTLVVAGCGGRRRRSGRDGRSGDDLRRAQELDKVTLQLKWVTQAQFAGYYAALEGYYETRAST